MLTRAGGAVEQRRGAISNQVDFENELVQLTTAYQEGNIFYLNPEAWYISPGGLVSMPSWKT